MFRLAVPSDLDGIISLWQEAFGDTPEEIRHFFDTFPHCLSYVTEDVSAMVHVLPQVLSPDVPAAYVYAVATRQSRRGRGLCRELMAFAEADLRRRGFACCVLAPGAPSLFGFYEKLGYAAAFTGSRPAVSGGIAISAAEYLRLREQLLQIPHMIYDETTLLYAQRIYGLTFYRTPAGIAAAAADFTAECLPEGLKDEPRAMIKWLDAPRTLERAWLGFDLG